MFQKIKKHSIKSFVLAAVLSGSLTMVLLGSTQQPDIYLDPALPTADTSQLSTNRQMPHQPDTSQIDVEPELTSQKTESVSAQPSTINTSASSFSDQSGETFVLRTYKPLATNDPSGDQWWVGDTGLNTVWSSEPGSKQTTVAVIDTGFALDHEELAGRWAKNTNEQGVASTEQTSKLNCTDRGLALDQSCNLIDDDFDGLVDNESGPALIQNPSQLNCTDAGLTLDKSCNLIDDDLNGFVDDVTGWDFVNGDPSVQAGQTNPNGNGTKHGTAVTGILAANGNNTKGIAGVDWQTKILPLQALDDDSYGNTLTVSRAIYYAADFGVDVINLSLGSEQEDTFLRQAIHYALSKNIVVVAASGNDGCDCILYPANYPEVVAVGAKDQTGSPASFSNFGKELDIIAPGANMITPSWSQALPASTYASNMGGTSLAAPYVSGLLSIARSHQPDAKWSELVGNLQATANHATLTTTNPFSPLLGHGYARADTYIARLTVPAQPLARYLFKTSPAKSTLGSSLVYQCADSSDFPTIPIYEITSGSSISYTVDKLERFLAIGRGDTVKLIAYTCIGLPTDLPSSVKVIDLLKETRNQQDYKAQPAI